MCMGVCTWVFMLYMHIIIINKHLENNFLLNYLNKILNVYIEYIKYNIQCVIVYIKYNITYNI